MQSAPVNRQFQLSAQGVTRYGLPKGAFYEAHLPLPPLEEQRTIAAFLDRETARVDNLVGQQEQLLERLAEYRTALIANTVTQGLPPEAAMAAGLDPYPDHHESGVGWLGRIPEHWKMERLNRSVLRSESKSGGEDRLPYVGLEHVESWTGDSCQQTTSSTR